MTLTDAAGDFLTYQVSLVSLQLTQADGSVVDTLPRTTTVDLAQLVNLGEILSSRQIPAGNYSSAKVTVDFTGAKTVTVNPVLVASVVAPEHKGLRIRGSIASVDSTAFEIDGKLVPASTATALFSIAHAGSEMGSPPGSPFLLPASGHTGGASSACERCVHACIPA